MGAPINTFRWHFEMLIWRPASGVNNEEKKSSDSKFKAIAPHRVRRFFAELGPGLITGAADDDPSGKILGERANSPILKWLGWATVAIMAVAAVAMFATM